MAGLIGLRRDIACAVLGSGPLVVGESHKSTDPGHSYFEATEKIALVAQNRALRLFVVSDKTDKQVPLAHQSGYVDKLRKAGRPIPQLFVEAPEVTDSKHHGVVSYTQLVTAGCVLGRADEEIARAVTTLVTRNVEYNQRRRKEAKDKASILAAARQPAPSLAVETTGKK